MLDLFGRAITSRPTLITDRPWDTLIILDACRLDAFRTAWPGCSSIISPGSCTLDWVEANFVRNPSAPELADVTIVTANPYSSKEFFETKGWTYPLGACISPWRTGWDMELDTVLPETVVEETIRAQKGDSDRFIVHFLQPHAPFIGEPSLPLPFGRDPELPMGYGVGDATWRAIKSGAVSIESAKAAYRGNLQLVLHHVRRLLGILEGRIVITSDHGELFGEYGLFGHPERVFVPPLVNVPWLELDSDPRDSRIP